MAIHIGKRNWAKPELIVLVRGRPEEAVLDVCKGLAEGGNITVQNHCETNVGCGNKCQSIAGS